MQKLIPDRAYRAEQRRIKSQINALSAEINEQRSKTVCDGDMTPITEFDAEKVDKFITKVKISKGIITFTFYNGVEISRKYDNGPSGNQRGWKQKQQEEEAWQ